MSQTLAFGFEFEELYSRDGLARLDSVFLENLREADPPFLERPWPHAPIPAD